MPRRPKADRPPTRIQVCARCGDPFETVEERERCYDCRPEKHGVRHESPKQAGEDDDR